MFHKLYLSKVTFSRCQVYYVENSLSMKISCHRIQWQNDLVSLVWNKNNAVMWEIWIKMTLSKISDVHNCLWLYVICIEIGLSRMIYHFLRHDNSLVTIPFQTWAHLLVILTAWNFRAHAIWRRYQGSLNIRNHRTFS